MSDGDGEDKVKGTLVPNLPTPSNISSVHVDKILVTTQAGSEIVTLTLLQMHIIPNRKPEGFILENASYSVVGELKVPISVMNELAVYYIHQLTGGLNVAPMMRKYLQEHARDEPLGRINFGPPGDVLNALLQEQQQ